MKFRNPKTGEVFYGITLPWIKFCEKQQNDGCYNKCPINIKAGGDADVSCLDWCEANPVDASRLMGYEVIEDDAPLSREATKKDTGKPHPSYVPPALIEACMEVREYGTAKYHDPENWRQVEMERYHNALLRHVLGMWNDPFSVDYESGLMHLSHVVCNAAFLLQKRKEGEA